MPDAFLAICGMLLHVPFAAVSQETSEKSPRLIQIVLVDSAFAVFYVKRGFGTAADVGWLKRGLTVSIALSF